MSVTTGKNYSTVPPLTEISTTPDDNGALMSNVVLMANGILDDGNSSNVALGPDETFTGEWIDVKEFASLTVTVFADVPSATDGVSIQFSSDGITGVTTDPYTYTNGGSTKTWSNQATLREYFRLQYTNGSTGQTSFDLTVMLNRIAGVATSHRIKDTVEGEDDGSLTTTILKAKRAGSEVYDNIDSTPEGALKSSVVAPTGALPVAQLTTLHDGKVLNYIDPDLYETAGTGTGTFTNNKYDMEVAAGEWQLIATRRFAPYFSGKPQKVELTFDEFAPQTGVVKKVGYFSSSTSSPYDSTLDGIYLESSNGTITLKTERAGVETLSVPIADWDGFDRLGDFRNVATWDNFTVIEFNFLWLGGAYLELRVVTDDGFVTAHTHAYVGKAKDVFIKSPNQQVRYEIRSTTGAGSFRYICNQVATAGSTLESGLSRGINTGTSSTTFSSVGTTYPIIAVRKLFAFRDNPVALEFVNIFVTSSDRILWTIEINPTLSAPLTYTPVANRPYEYAAGNGAITVTTPGSNIGNDYLTSLSPIQDVFNANYLSFLSGQLDGTQDEYVLTLTPLTNNVSAFASMNLRTG